MSEIIRDPGSFRDPDAFLYYKEGELYRGFYSSNISNYQNLMSSGLYERLTEEEKLIKHDEIQDVHITSLQKVIKPEIIPFISYPYEWSFSQLKDAAILTLEIVEIALNKGMILKDASAFNIQFLRGKPIFIDTASFEIYNEGEPWKAYRQFCEHFLAPLALMSYKDHRLNKLLLSNIDGIPLDICSELLPCRTRFSIGLQMHIHTHARIQRKYNRGIAENSRRGVLPISSLKKIIWHLKDIITGLKWKLRETEWGKYYSNTNYSDRAETQKKLFIEKVLLECNNVKTALDIGSNNGYYSRIVSDKDIYTISADIDEVAVEKNYILARSNNETNILPLQIDICNPSPAIGWDNTERKSFLERTKVDLLLALALTHHLVITNHLSFAILAERWAALSTYLIIEFVPEEDDKAAFLLRTKMQDPSKLNLEYFENCFSNFFILRRKEKLEGSYRTIYFYESRKNTF